MYEDLPGNCVDGIMTACPTWFEPCLRDHETARPGRPGDILVYRVQAMVDLRKAVVATVLVVAALGLSIGVASSAAIEVPSLLKRFGLKANSSGVTYYGKVNSRKSACKRERRVKVVRKSRRGRDRVFIARTAGKGRFRLNLPGAELRRGTYIAKLKRASFRDGGKQVVCERSKLGELRVR